MSNIKKIFYAELTFPEAKQVVAEQRVAILPTGTMEQHGLHLPLKMDCIGPMEVAKLTAEKLAYEVIVMPPVYYGMGSLNTNFPGTIDITEQNFIGYVADILLSLAHHGFQKIIILDGHGGNVPFMNLAMRRLNSQKYPDTVACVITWFDLIKQEDLKKFSDSDFGGMGHAGELETSIALHTDPDLIQMDKAKKEPWQGDIRSYGQPFKGGTSLGVASYVGWMGGMGGSKYGVMGDPTDATAEKGKKWLDSAVDSLAEFVLEWKKMPVKKAPDHH